MLEGKLLSVLSSIERNRFKERSSERQLLPKEHIDVSSCPGLVVVRRGRLRVYLTTETGREITLFSICPDEVCIMSSPCILWDSPFNIFIEASAQSLVEIIPKDLVETTKYKNPSFAAVLLSLLGEKMGLILRLIDDLLVKRIDVRIAGFLMESGGIHNMSHEDLANHIGSSREVVSRTLKHMESEGIVDLKRKTVIIKDSKQLESLILSS